MPTIPPLLTPAPLPAPNRGDRTTFSGRVDAFVTWLTNAVAEFSAIVTNVYNNAVDANNNAVASAASAAASAASESAAATAASAAMWVSGANYAQGVCAISPANFIVYRRKVAGAGATDPSLDSVNWSALLAVNTIGGGTQYQQAVVAGCSVLVQI